MVDRTMTGVHPVLQIPYDAHGRIDEEDLRREVEWAIECGVDGLAIALGSSVVRLTEDERDYVLRTVVDQAKGRTKVCMNTGAESTHVALHYSRRARELGADSLMIWQPAYFSAGTGATVQHFKTIAEAVDLPVFLQDTPSSPCPPSLMVRLAREHENLCYGKVEFPPTIPRMNEVARLRGDSGLIIFGGNSGFFVVEEFRRGSVGTMPSCTMPDRFVQIWRLWQQGDEAGAEREFHRIEGVLRTTEIFGLGIFAAMYQEMLVRRGIFKCAYARGVHESLDRHQIGELERQMELAGLSVA